MLYFRGCTARERLTNVANATGKLLDLANINYNMVGDEGCCGSVLLRTGFPEEAKKQMEKNITNLNLENEKIVVSCAGCYKTLKKDYKNILGVELDVIHISQLLKQLINEGKISPNKGSLKVTYHDPCHLGRHSDEFDAPREVITNFSDLIEMENVKEDAKCCGSGGGVKSAFPDLANSIAINRGKEAEATGAEILVTSCPFCELNLEENSSLKIMDLSEFVLKHLKKEETNHLEKKKLEKLEKEDIDQLENKKSKNLKKEEG
ncbi:(Fe-S)-binding protein [Methanobrevibacter cuticularis]